MQNQFDEVILVYVPEEVSKKRLMQRNNLTEKQAEDRLLSQMSIEKKKEMADVVFSNVGDTDALKVLVENYFNEVKSGS